MNLFLLYQKKNNSFLKSVVLLSIIAMLSSCGFHLRGHQSLENSVDLKGAKIYLAVTNEDMRLHRQIKVDLQFLGLDVIDDALEPAIHLIVSNSSVDKRAIGIDSIGRNNQFEIIHNISYLINYENLQKSVGQNMIEAEGLNDDFVLHNLTTRRNFYLDNEDLIGKRAEEATLLDAMREELSRKLVNHLVISLNRYKTSSIN